MIITLFAEENLDDITYREAIMLGNFSHILVSSKLISPIKWLSLFVCGLYDLITTAMVHYINKWFVSMYHDMQAISSSWYHAFPLLLKLLGFMAVLTVPFMSMPGTYAMMLTSLPLLTRMLFCLANPINQIIRPVSNYFNISSVYVSIAMVMSGILCCAALATLGTSASLTTTLVTLSVVLSILERIATVIFVKNTYDVSPDLGYFVGALIGLSTMLSLIRGNFLPPAVETLSDALLLFASNLSDLGLTGLGCIFLSNMTDRLSELYTTLPYPKERAPDRVKQAINGVAKKSFWSHSLFNTPVINTVQSDEKPYKSRQEVDSLNESQRNKDFSYRPLLLT